MLEKQVEETIKKFNMLEKGDKVVVGVSGGPDSMTLLKILISLKEKYSLTLFVAHVNHMIRENAKIDEEYVKEFCKENNIECFIKRSDVVEKSQKEKKGLEEAGREVRYNFFNEVLKNTNSNKIAIAHNSNDNAETIIMNAIRGTGISGLKGIEPKRDEFIRPLIETSREMIEEYCKQNNVNPRHDESNDDNTYTRNKTRNIVIPYIKKEYNPNIVSTLKRLSEIVRENEEFLKIEVEKQYNEIIISEGNKIIYDLKKFNSLDIVLQKRLILFGVEKLFGDTKGIEKINLEDIIKLCNNNVGNKYLTPNKRTKIEVKEKKIFIEKI